MEPSGLEIITSFMSCKKQYPNKVGDYSALDSALIALNYNPQISENLMEPSGLEPLTPCMP